MARHEVEAAVLVSQHRPLSKAGLLLVSEEVSAANRQEREAMENAARELGRDLGYSEEEIELKIREARRKAAKS